MMNLQRMARDTGLTLLECQQHRIAYLKRHIEELSQNAQWLSTDDGELSPIFCRQVCEEIISESKELRHLIFISRPNYKRLTGTITAEMIEAAKRVPVEDLVEFHRGKALAFCHEDKYPSLSLYQAKNFCRCFVCSKSFNPIDILIHRDNYSFIDAVRRLAA